MRRVANLRRGFLGSGAFAAGSVLLAVGAMGVVVPRAAELERKAEEREREVLRVERAREVVQSSERFAAEGLIERIAEAERLVDALLPELVQPIDLHAALTFVARAEGVVLEGVVQGELADPGLAVLDDWIALREVALFGRASIASLSGFVGGLCSLGFPVVVLDVSLAREHEEGLTGDDLFAFALTLGALERAPLATRPPSDEWSRETGDEWSRESDDEWSRETGDEGGR